MSADTPYTILLERVGDTPTLLDADQLGNRWTQGLHDVVIDGQGGSLQITTTREANTDDAQERPVNAAGTDENNGRSYGGTRYFTKGDLIQAAAKGATVLYLLAAGAAANTARYVVGNMVRIASDDSEGYDSQGRMGYPNAPDKVQYASIKAINVSANSITLDAPLLHDHSTDVRDYPTDWGGTGLPRITSLDRTAADGYDGYTYLRSLGLKNLQILRPANGGLGYLINPCHTLTIEDCDIDNYFQPSQIWNLLVRRTILRQGGEMDKELGTGLFQYCQILGPLTNGRWYFLRVEDSTFATNYSPAGKVQEYARNTFTAGVQQENGQTITAYGSLFPQPGHKPVDSFTLEAGQTFVTAAGNTAPGHIEYAPHDFYTVEVTDSSNDLVVPASGFVSAGQDFYRQTCIGMAISTVDGSKRGYITGRRWNKATEHYYYQHTAPKFAVGEKLVYSYCRNFLDYGGHTLDSKRLFHQNSARFQGNTGTGGSYNFQQAQRDLTSVGNRQIPVFGTQSQLTVNVTAAGAAGTFLEVSNYPMVTKPDGSTSRRIARIDLSQVGTRTITLTTATGSVGTDDLKSTGLGWVEALDFYWPSGAGQFTITGLWANSEAPLD